MAAAKSAPKALAKFTISEEGDDFRLHIEDDGGETLELTATAEQLDLIAETIDQLLGSDDSVDAVDDEDEVEDAED
jgi:hypothetical protein